MMVVYSLEEFPKKEKPVVLTIGNFDGLHAGHQSVIERLCVRAKENKALSVVLTFSNHPSTVLRPDRPIPLITPRNQKLELFKDMGVDIVILLEFTRAFSRQSAEDFLKKLTDAMNLECLVLGHDSRLGKDREGDAEFVRAFAAKNGFTAEYLEEKLVNGRPVSSSKVRQLIERGYFEDVEKLLGRKYSLILPVQKGKGLGKQIGFSTANFDVQGLSIPPIGVYSVWLKENGKVYESVANLGFAPTVRGSSHPQLEVHVIGKNIDLLKKEVEIIFYRFIRKEKKFASIKELKDQISLDIEIAKSQFQSR